MKWFTRAEDEADNPLKPYREHLARLEPSLSPGARDLASVTIGDAKVRSWNWRGGDFLLSLSTIGPREAVEDVTIEYLDARVETPSHHDLNAMRLLDGNVDLLNSEVDRDEDGRLVHRHWAWPTGKFQVHFRDVTVARSPSSAVERHRLFDRPVARSNGRKRTR